LACDSGKNSKKQDITLEQLKMTLRKILDAGVRKMYVIGGEPTIHENFYDIVDEINKYKWDRKGICTNGVGLSEKAIKIIEDAFDYVSVSVRGTEKTTTSITGNPESYSKTIATLKKLSSSDIDILVGIDLLPEHFNEFSLVIDSLEKNNITFKNIDIHRIIPIGGANVDNVASLPKYRSLLETIDSISKKSNHSIIFEDCLPLCLVDKKYWKYIHTCMCGTSKVWVDPYGKVRRCACTSGAIGDINTENLEDIWTSKGMEEFHSYEWVDSECKKCKIFDECRGGCPSSRGVKFFDKDIFSDNFKAIK